MEEEGHQIELIPVGTNQHHITLLPRTATDLPFFYLTKQKKQLVRPIEFQGTDQAGRPMHWSVTPNPSPKIGAPAIEAHEAWVRLVMPAITNYRNAEGKIPSIIPLGGVRACLRTVGWTEGGFTARRLLRALRQIGAAWCVADFWMPTSDADESGQPKFEHVKGEFSRMAIYAIGSKHLTDEQLRDGNFDFDFDLEDTVYIQLHPLEVSLQQSQAPRLVDNQYMFSIGPAARRWYELVAPKIYGAVKYKKPFCEIRYSWYVRHHHTLKRRYDRRGVVFQMKRVTADHLRLGYISGVEYRAIKEPGKEIDYLIRYFPGPEARASIDRIRSHAWTGRTATFKIPAYTDGETGNINERYIEEPPVRRQRTQQGSAHPKFPELTRRGIAPQQAEKLLSRLADDQPLEDQLEWGDYLVQNGKIENPPGFYTYLIRDNIPVPETFETSRKRMLRQETQAARAATEQQAAQSRLDYERYQDAEINRYIVENETVYEQLVAGKRAQFLANAKSDFSFRPEMIDLMVAGAVRAAIRQRVVFNTFEEFCRQRSVGEFGRAPGAAEAETGGPGATDAAQPDSTVVNTTSEQAQQRPPAAPAQQSETGGVQQESATGFTV